METTKHSTQEDTECKKAKMFDNELKDASALVKQETVVDFNRGKADISVALDSKSNNGEACSLPIEGGRDVSVHSNEVQVNEIYVLESESKESKDISADLECEEREGVSVELVDEDPKELENEKDVSIVAVDAIENEIESAEKKDAWVANCGIKEDNDLYALAKSSSSSFSRKKLLVLDLNGLLADIVSSPPKDFVPDFNIGTKAIFKRPFCEDFLKFCFEKFEVGIWSSRSQRKMEIITDFLLGDMKSKLLFCWGISNCTKIVYGSLGNKDKYVGFKEIKRLWEVQDPDSPWMKGDYNETNTVLLDDSPHKALLNPPHTAVFPHSYDYNSETDTSLGEGGDVRVYLEKLAEADNVQEFIKKHPFGQEPITEASECWEFYSQIIGNYRCSNA